MTSKEKVGAGQDEDGEGGEDSSIHSRPRLWVISGWLDRPQAVNEEAFIAGPRNPGIAFREWRLDEFETFPWAYRWYP